MDVSGQSHWEVRARDEDAWLIDYVREVIAKPVPELPSQIQHFGSSTVHWAERSPGEAAIWAVGGSIDDRTFAEQLCKTQLEGHGYRRAQFYFEGANGANQRTAGWPDIMAKAKRLIQSGNVTMLRNGWNNIVAHVIGDHGEYNCEIGRDDPNSQAITTWTCECPWDQYAWGRTRDYKKFEGRPCAHVLAAYWRSKSVPLDDYDPNVHGPAPRGQRIHTPPDAGKGPVAPSILSPLQGDVPESPEAPEAPAPPGAPKGPAGPQMPGPPGLGPDATGGPANPLQQPLAPPGAPGILPPSPLEQMQMMQPPNPGQTPGGGVSPPGSVSIPGAKIPTPFNPIQYPGGTYSRTAAQEFFPQQAVILKNNVWGQMEGKSEAHGAGQYHEVQARRPDGQPQHAEVMGQDPTTGWIEIIISNDAGKAMEPFLTRCFVEPSDIEPARNTDPGFIRRN
jgi:hypothetical protein